MIPDLEKEPRKVCLSRQPLLTPRQFLGDRHSIRHVRLIRRLRLNQRVLGLVYKQLRAYRYGFASPSLPAPTGARVRLSRQTNWSHRRIPRQAEDVVDAIGFTPRLTPGWQ